MKIMTILGTRPEIIRLCRIIHLLDQCCEHVLVHTGQNFDPKLSDCFFSALGVRQPNYCMGVAEPTPAAQIGKIMSGIESIFQQEQPDRILILGDTNSALSAFVAKRMGIKVFHMEAGNRCFDDRVPEEVNRRVIDHSSDILMPYTEGSRERLLREGFHPAKVIKTGNPIYEVLSCFEEEIDNSSILTVLGLKTSEYFLVTIHRAENVDDPVLLAQLLESFNHLEKQYDIPIIISTHPRTRKRLEKFDLTTTSNQIRFLEPFAFFDFVHLEKNAHCVLSDSGTVQEECSIFNVPNVTLRLTTERPETLECGSNILSGCRSEDIDRAVSLVLQSSTQWHPPEDYLVPNVSETVARIIMSTGIMF